MRYRLTVHIKSMQDSAKHIEESPMAWAFREEDLGSFTRGRQCKCMFQEDVSLEIFRVEILQPT